MNRLYLNIDKRYIDNIDNIDNIDKRSFKENNWSKHLTLTPIDESKEIKKIYEELWNKIRDLIRSITNKLNDYDEKYIKIKLYLDNDLPLNNSLELYNTIIVLRSVLVESMQKPLMLEYNIIHESKGIN